MGFGRSGHALRQLLRNGCTVHRRRQTWKHIGLEIRANRADHRDPRTRTRFSWRRWVTLTGRTRSAAFSVRKMEERAGKDLFTTKTREPSIWLSSPGNPRVIYASLCRREGRRGASIPPQMVRAAGSIAPVMGAPLGHVSGQGLPAEDSEGLASRLRRATRANLSDRGCQEGGLFRSDNAGQSWQRVSTDSASWGRVVLRELSVAPRMRTPSMFRTPQLTSRATEGRRLQLSKARQGRRLSRTVDDR